MITKDNYFQVISKVSKESLPADLKEAYDFVNEATGNGKTWEAYEDSTLKDVFDTYFAKLDKHLNSQGKTESSVKPADKKAVKTSAKPIRADKLQTKKVAKGTPVVEKPALKAKKSEPEKPKPTEDVNLVERIPEELKFLRRFINLDGKVKTEKQLLNLLNSLQKAILEKRIRKTSPWVKQISYMQDRLIEAFNSMKQAMTCRIPKKVLNEFKALLSDEKVYPSVAFIKRYIGLNGRSDVRDRAINLQKAIQSAFAKKSISKNDPYYNEVLKILDHLTDYVNGKGTKRLEIEESTLNGLEGILGCACQDLSGVDEEAEESDQVPTFMNSVDFVKLNFDTIGLTGKWFDLIGDPCPGFTAMIFGKPKMGKSYLAVEFAGYLARHHGKVLYVAKEEKLDATLQIKLKEKGVAHPNLDISDHILHDLENYDFIFLDSVNTLELSPEELQDLETTYPEKSFLYIFQSTKSGNFRGGQPFQHNVDVVIEVPERGKAVQFGRFNQGGEMRIFDELQQAA